MIDTNIGKLNLEIGINIDFSTAYMCLRLVEIYLNNNGNETLKIFCDECGNWDLDILSREVAKAGEQDEMQ